MTSTSANRQSISSKNRELSFEEIILSLKTYWQKQGCAILEPYDLEVGAGTFHSATVLKTMSLDEWNVVYLQGCRRPTDGRFGIHPNRLQHYYQMQVILKPSPDNIQQLYLNSLISIGLDYENHDIRFVEDDWESPTLGASGLGWEVWCNGMEVSQFTYMQQMCGLTCRPVPGEITYGLERLALYIQKKDHFKDIVWSWKADGSGITYGDIFCENERQFSIFNAQFANTKMLIEHFKDFEKQAQILSENNLPLPAYDHCIKASHVFNLLDARGVISSTERVKYISKVRELAKACCISWMNVSKRI